jgi:hypothetical protein
MQLKPITAVAVLMLVFVSLLVSGCTISTTSPSPTISTTSPSPKVSTTSSSPTLTTPTPDGSATGYSATFAKIMEDNGWVRVKAISQTADDVYSGSYKAKDQIFNVTIEVPRTKDEAIDRFVEIAHAKEREGYKLNYELGNSTIWGDHTASWGGYRTNPDTLTRHVFLTLIADNQDINSSVVVYLSGNVTGSSLPFGYDMVVK